MEFDEAINNYDYTECFTTNQVFSSRDLLSNWVRATAKNLGLVIVVTHSEVGGCGRKPRIRFGCERSGTYKKRKIQFDHEPKKTRSVGTRKCDCPFDLNGVKLSNEDDWMVKVRCGLHNHPPIQHLEGHPYVARLTSEEIKILIDMSKSMVKPRNILMTLKDRNPKNASTMRTIYNARARYRLVEKAGKTKMQQLLSKLSEQNYIEWHNSDTRTDEVRDLFFAHPASIDLLIAFPHVLIMDCTYKTNRYRLPLLEIVGPNDVKSCSIFLECFHFNVVKECIFNIVNVGSDGNCGFRAIASSLGLGEEAWQQIRHELTQELNCNSPCYEKLYGTIERVKELLYILDFSGTCAPFDKWMTMPEMGHLIASRYDIVLVLLSAVQCLTFLPLHSPPPSSMIHKIISLGFVNGNHFVQVNLKSNCPIPPVARNWYKYRDDIASEWEMPYVSRIEKFRKMIGADVAVEEFINLNSP